MCRSCWSAAIAGRAAVTRTGGAPLHAGVPDRKSGEQAIGRLARRTLLFGRTTSPANLEQPSRKSRQLVQDGFHPMVTSRAYSSRVGRQRIFVENVEHTGSDPVMDRESEAPNRQPSRFPTAAALGGARKSPPKGIDARPGDRCQAVPRLGQRPTSSGKTVWAIIKWRTNFDQPLRPRLHVKLEHVLISQCTEEGNHVRFGYARQ